MSGHMFTGTLYNEGFLSTPLQHTLQEISDISHVQQILESPIKCYFTALGLGV